MEPFPSRLVSISESKQNRPRLKGDFTMKKLLTWITLIALCATMLPAAALAESWYCSYCSMVNDMFFCKYCGKSKWSAATDDIYSLAIDKIATRTGPSTKYSEKGTYNLKGQYLHITAKAWDSSNCIWWVEVEIPGVGLLWTGAKRFDASTLQLSVLAEEVWTYQPSAGGYISGSSGTGNSGGSSSITNTNNSSNSSNPYGWLIGKWGVVCVNEGHARTGAGTNYSKADVVYYGEWYEILEVKRGDTTKDWAKVRGTTGKTFWISTGLLEIDGYQGGGDGS